MWYSTSPHPRTSSHFSKNICNFAGAQHQTPAVGVFACEQMWIKIETRNRLQFKKSQYMVCEEREKQISKLNGM